MTHNKPKLEDTGMTIFGMPVFIDHNMKAPDAKIVPEDLREKTCQCCGLPYAHIVTTEKGTEE